MINVQLPELNIGFINTGDISEVPTKISGLYFFYSAEKELLYIGIAKNIRARILQHINKTGYKETNNTYNISHNFKYVRILTESCPIKRCIYETFAINNLKPKLNRNKTFTYKSDFYSEEYNLYL